MPLLGIQALFDQIQESLDSKRSRTIIGLIGKPGAGKSTLSTRVLEVFKAPEVVIFPMDGFHLSNKILIEQNLRERKGAPETFDALGFTETLRRIKNSPLEKIYYPIFHREIEESIAAEGVVLPESRVVIVEGNYLLSEEFGWNGVFSLLDHTWFVATDEELRRNRLILRHQNFGKSEEEARAWSLGSDERNAEFIEVSRWRAENEIVFD